jgi:hypothetical protein
MIRRHGYVQDSFFFWRRWARSEAPLPQDWHFSLALGALLNIAYTAGSFSPTLFTMLVIMALVTTASTVPILNWIKFPADPVPRTPHSIECRLQHL